ncbi:hypothetical protein pEaSNUABM8_00202 [Erwinia phage pEa_SNUABM_8]|nr:hypothetical protein pEaSNUABM8_00202 [Erwinia phage pEa_SNUABM_8]QVW54954.1 hypothetical protein pEaSNUABM4_00201 [Erwinia phage pEa_SNUABM_4]
MNRKDTNNYFRLNDAIHLLTDMNKLERGSDKAIAYHRKLGETLGRTLFSEMLEPYYSVNSVRCLTSEEMHRGNLYLTLTGMPEMNEFVEQYRKALVQAEIDAETKRPIDDVTATLEFFAPLDTEIHTTAMLRIRYTMAGTTDPMSYVTEMHHDFKFSMVMSHSNNLVENPQMPDIEERSIASPVYLVNSQNVKSTFGHTVRENPLAIYLCARRYGWSEVFYHGQQVLLKADIHVR